jgi:Protein of unknown function (DUF2505)
MQFSYDMLFDAEPDEIFALVLDRDYLLGRCAATGSVPLEVSIAGSSQSGAQVRVRRRVPMLLPPFAARFAPEGVVIEHVETWSPPEDDGARTANLAGTMEGAPGSLTGWLRIGREPTGTSYAVRGDITVPVPLLGERLARFAAEQMRLALQAEEEFTHRWLAQRAG